MGIKYSDVDKYIKGEEVPQDVKEKIESMAKKSQHKREMPYKFKN